MMSAAGQDFVFSPLPLRQHRVIDGDKSRYRIYQPGGEFRTVEAKTAYEAFKASGFKEAARIVRVTRYVNPYLHKNELTEAVASEQAKASATPVKPTIPAATPSAAFVAAPPETGAPVIQPAPEAVGTVPLAPMVKPVADMEGIEEISSVSTPIQVKVPSRSLASEAPGGAPQQKPERTMLSVQDIDKLLGK